MNKIQKNYATALALLETLKAEENQIEKDYIRDNKIVNPDGSIPSHIWCMDDAVEFDKANLALDKLTSHLDTYGASKLLKRAEDALIEYALEIAPDSCRETLAKAARDNAKIRKELVNLTMRLDTRTVKGA